MQLLQRVHARTRDSGRTQRRLSHRQRDRGGQVMSKRFWLGIGLGALVALVAAVVHFAGSFDIYGQGKPDFNEGVSC